MNAGTVLHEIELVDVTVDNWEEIAELTVAPDEAGFVASNLYSLAQSKFEPSACPLAIVANDVPVGFMMYERDDEEPGAVMIYRFMVDHRHRGHGYGRSAMTALLKRFEADSDVHVVRVCFVPSNHSARRLYASLGFAEAGADTDGEIIAELRMRP